MFGAALLRPRLRARLIMVVQEKVKAKGGDIFGAAYDIKKMVVQHKVNATGGAV